MEYPINQQTNLDYLKISPCSICHQTNLDYLEITQCSRLDQQRVEWDHSKYPVYQSKPVTFYISRNKLYLFYKKRIYHIPIIPINVFNVKIVYCHKHSSRCAYIYHINDYMVLRILKDGYYSVSLRCPKNIDQIYAAIYHKYSKFLILGVMILIYHLTK